MDTSFPIYLLVQAFREYLFPYLSVAFSAGATFPWIPPSLSICWCRLSVNTSFPIYLLHSLQVQPFRGYLFPYLSVGAGFP